MFTKLLLVLILFSSTLVLAEDYDAIVSDLKSNLRESSIPEPVIVDDSEKIELGMAFSGAFVNAGVGHGTLMKGFDLHFGLELFSPRWAAEGSFRSFGSEELASHYSASLREFDLRLVHKSDLDRNWIVRTGFGLSARYLTTSDSRSGSTREQTDKTPAFVGALGVERALSAQWSIGPDISYRGALISSAKEHASADVNMRMNLRF